LVSWAFWEAVWEANPCVKAQVKGPEKFWEAKVLQSSSWSKILMAWEKELWALLSPSSALQQIEQPNMVYLGKWSSAYTEAD
jgi:hypothetical protein